jgi:hypothetical protein
VLYAIHCHVVMNTVDSTPERPSVVDEWLTRFSVVSPPNQIWTTSCSGSEARSSTGCTSPPAKPANASGGPLGLRSRTSRVRPLVTPRQT